MNNAPNLCGMTLTLMFSAIGDHLAGIANPPAPKTLSDHLIALFMSVTEFYHDSNVPMPCEVCTLMRDMQQCAHRADAAHALELRRAIGEISGRPGLVADSTVRFALARANDALTQRHS